MQHLQLPNAFTILKLKYFLIIAQTTKKPFLQYLLLLFLAHLHNLHYVVIGSKLQWPNIHLDVIIQEILSQCLNFPGPCCRPHQNLVIRLKPF